MSIIIDVHARQILDSRGNPTVEVEVFTDEGAMGDRKSTRLNSSHMSISYAVFCLKKKKQRRTASTPSPRATNKGPSSGYSAAASERAPRAPSTPLSGSAQFSQPTTANAPPARSST